jgi:hypothetical protein
MCDVLKMSDFKNLSGIISAVAILLVGKMNSITKRTW